MRIIYDITSHAQVMCYGKPYLNGPGKMGFSSAQIGVVICREENELPIHIEGDSKFILEALKSAVSQIELIELDMLEEYGESRNTNCAENCDDVDSLNGCHLVTCKKHPNYDTLNEE